jgi:hypothetical protein
MRSVRYKWAALVGGVAALGLIGVMGSQSFAQDDQARAKTPAPPARCLGYPLEETRVIDSSTLYARDQSGHAALIKMKGPCLEPDEAIGIKYYGTNQICGPLDVDISGSALTGIPRMCMIDTVTPLSKDEAKAYAFGKSRG